MSPTTETDEYTHNEYPHEPGTLYDCHACESDCFCETGEVFICVYCSIWDEQNCVCAMEVDFPCAIHGEEN